MSCYISSNENRFYVNSEAGFGAVASITEANRFPAVRLNAQQASERLVRRDKTGGRTFTGLPAGTRRSTSYELETYMTSWGAQGAEPAYGPLFAGAMGEPGALHAGGTVDAMLTSTRVRFTAAHNLTAGQSVTFGGEMRFVSSVVDSLTVNLHAPFTIQPTNGSATGPSITYKLGKELPSVSLFDFWQAGAVSRILAGAAVDELKIRVNGDFHGFKFSGPASDLIDSASFATGQGGLAQFPVEPALTSFDYAVIPGHLGQVWLGSTPTRFYTLTEAELTLDNDVETRFREFGSSALRCVSAGRRTVNLNFELFAEDSDATRGLYQAARQQSPISAMFQMGQQPGQLFGAYLSSIIPEVPAFDDSESRLQWSFRNCRAHGTADDELVIAFG